MIYSKPNEDGIIFAYGEKHDYFVIYECEGETYAKIETAKQIFDKMDMSDCYDISIQKLFLINGIDLIHCDFNGTWHDGKDPLKMEIKDTTTHEVYDIGYGTDH